METFYEMEGTLELPFKESNNTCIWRIKAALGYKIKIKIEEFNIRSINKACKNNHVIIYDGFKIGNNSKKLTAKECGYALTNKEFIIV